MARNVIAISLVVLALSLTAAFSQDYVTSISAVRQNQRIRLDLNLPSSATSSEAYLSSVVEIVIANPQICCGKNSALAESSFAQDHPSLQEIGNKVNGAHALADGHKAIVTSHFIPGSAVTSDRILASLLARHPMLMEWNSHAYVLYGAIYDETIYTDGHRDYAIRKLLLFDPNATAANRETAFDRQKDDWSKVEGFLFLKATLQ